MAKLNRYSSESKIMDVTIEFGDETFKFNLNRELVISGDKINSEIKEQPTAYAFLTMLNTKLFHEMNKAEAEMEEQYSKIYNRYKEKVNENTGRIYDKEYAEHIANANPLYQNKKKTYLELKGNYGVINTCVKSFEQRAFLIQTLSANLRKEN